MLAKIGDIVGLIDNFDEYEKGELWRVVKVKNSIVTGRPMYDLVRLRTGDTHYGIYAHRFEICKNNNRDMY